eukprot:m.82151 g.82151  ORF g.82151 m.82151 type:complete len:452 (+) comp14602_c0_seq1:154-1509(+)
MLFHNEVLVSFTENLLGIAATISAESLSNLDQDDELRDFKDLVQRRLNYFSYAMAGFCIVALVRRSHIQMYRFIGYGNHVVMGLNFVELAMICIIPVTFIGLEMTESSTPVALCAGLLSTIFMTRLVTLYYTRDRGLWGHPLEGSTHASAIQEKDDDGDYAGGIGLVPGQEEAYVVLRAQFIALSVVAAILTLAAAFSTRVAGLGMASLIIVPHLLRMAGIIPPITADMLGWDKPRFVLFRDAVFSIIVSLLALSLDPRTFFRGGVKLVPVVAAYIAGFFVTAVLYIVNFSQVHHIAHLNTFMAFLFDIKLGSLLIIPFVAKLYTSAMYLDKNLDHKQGAGNLFTGAVFLLGLFQLLFWLACLHTQAATISRDSKPADLHTVTLNAMVLPIVAGVAFALSFATHYSTLLLALIPAVWTALVHAYGVTTKRSDVLARRLLNEGERFAQLSDI